MNRILFFLLVIMMLALAGCAAQAVETGEPGPADDYAVYAVLLNSAIFPNVNFQQAVIRDVTEYDLAAAAASARDQFRAKTAGLDPAAMDAFEQNNKQPVSLEQSQFLPTPPVTIINQGDLVNLLANALDLTFWEAFYKQYPGAPGVITLTRVGFNQNASQAVVEIGLVNETLTGSGYLVHLVRSGGKWVVRSKLLSWP